MAGEEGDALLPRCMNYTSQLSVSSTVCNEARGSTFIAMSRFDIVFGVLDAIMGSRDLECSICLLFTNLESSERASGTDP